MQHPRLRQEARDLGGDFAATYMSLRNLRMVVSKQPQAACEAFVDLVGRELADIRHAGQTHARLMYREAALCLAATAQGAHNPQVADQAWKSLRRRVLDGRGDGRFAAAEAMGCMDLDIPEVCEAIPDVDPPRADLADVLKQAGAEGRPEWRGRTLVAPAGESLVCLKALRRGEDPACLAREAWWSLWAAERMPDADFRPPRPLEPPELGLVRVRDLNGRAGALHESGLVLAYRAEADYFRYPNDDRPGGPPPPEDFLAVMERSARHAGRLISLGAAHAALIPLFHNRVQGHRRDDEGRYQWRRLGRLDRWLESCKHPNFGPTGIRDFEHLVPAGRGVSLYRETVAQVMSLLLVAGSFFRAREPGLRGLDPDGEPVDARRLFDRRLLCKAVHAVLEGFHTGLAGRPLLEQPLDADELAGRMIEEMGVDRHMVEHLRVTDQQGMDDETFRAFLQSHGLSPAQAARRRRGLEDIPLLTGPHLGPFNGSMSLPELVEFSAAAAALCLAARRRVAVSDKG